MHKPIILIQENTSNKYEQKQVAVSWLADLPGELGAQELPIALWSFAAIGYPSDEVS